MSHHRLSLAAGLVAANVVVLIAGCGTPSQLVNATKAPEPIIQVVTTVTAAEPAASSADESQPTPNETPALDGFEFIEMQPPDLCKPEDPDYSDLSEFWDKEIISAADSAYAEITYQNRYEQKFGIVVLSSNDEEGTTAIRTYIEEAQVCLETMANEFPVAVTPEPIDASQPITDPEELALIDEFVARVERGSDTPLGLSVFLGVAVPDNWYREYDRLRVELGAGELTQTDFAMIEEYASNFGRTEPVFSKLESLKQGEMEPQRFAEWFVRDFLDNQEGVVHFSIDPNIKSIAAFRPHKYRAFCNVRSARVKMDVKKNDVTLRFWRYGSFAIKGPRSIPQDHTSGWWSLSSTSPATFDILVIGGRKDGRYVLNSGWVTGSGCR